jgi:hypothetical protein
MSFPCRRTNSALVIRRLAPLVFAVSRLGAQRTGLPPIRLIQNPSATATDSIGSIAQLIQLSDGRVLINDSRRARLYLLDPALANATVVLGDSAKASDRAYPRRGGAIFSYRADTTLFLDLSSEALLVLDPRGRVVRVMALPRPADAALIVGFMGATSARVDPQGRITYHPRAPSQSTSDTVALDSAPVLRVDIRTRVLDTVGFTRFDTREVHSVTVAIGGKQAELPAAVIRPFQRQDDWTMTADGTVAFVRAQTSSIDWVGPDGTHRSTPSPHDWRRLSGDDKVAIMDSLKAYYSEHPPTMMSASTGSQTTVVPYVPTFADPASLPDYAPAFATGVIPDADGNLWIPAAITTILPVPPGSVAAPTVYQVVNRAGVMVDRVQIPVGTNVVGFGPGVAYLSSRLGTTVSLIRVRIR